MPNSFHYLLLGAGRQGTAAAYDLARFGEAASLTLADADIARAQAAADRITQLTGFTAIRAIALDVNDGDAVADALRGQNVALSAVPYYFNLPLTQAAIVAGVSFCDLGGNTDIVRAQHALDADARAAGVAIVPDCGMGPGMGNTLAVYAMELLDNPQHVRIYDAGLPQAPEPPWNYLATFNIEGLINEYHDGMTVLREGELVHLPCFTELETIHVPGVGHLEAFVLAGGVSTAPWTFQNRLASYDLKVCRYPGTFAQLKAFSDLGLFSPQPVDVRGSAIRPRDLFQVLFEPQVRQPVMRDVCLIRAVARGTHTSRTAQARVDLVDHYDEATGFTSMERTTGWHLAIVAAMLARGEIAPGAAPLEIAVPAATFVAHARRRGFQIIETVEVADPSTLSVSDQFSISNS
ncbi:MAG: saccharopine dehydrogenase C-terminal domain-containing protein [Anaerolineae bacterium]